MLPSLSANMINYMSRIKWIRSSSGDRYQKMKYNTHTVWLSHPPAFLITDTFCISTATTCFFLFVFFVHVYNVSYSTLQYCRHTLAIHFIRNTCNYPNGQDCSTVFIKSCRYRPSIGNLAEWWIVIKPHILTGI